MDEITTKDTTRKFVEKIDSYYKSNAKGTSLIFTSRNKKDADVLSFGGKSVRRFRLDKLTDEEIESVCRRVIGAIAANTGAELRA